MVTTPANERGLPGNRALSRAPPRARHPHQSPPPDTATWRNSVSAWVLVETPEPEPRHQWLYVPRRKRHSASPDRPAVTTAGSPSDQGALLTLPLCPSESVGHRDPVPWVVEPQVPGMGGRTRGALARPAGQKPHRHVGQAPCGAAGSWQSGFQEPVQEVPLNLRPHLQPAAARVTCPRPFRTRAVRSASWS